MPSNIQNSVEAGLLAEGTREGVDRLVRIVARDPTLRWAPGELVAASQLRRKTFGAYFRTTASIPYSVSGAAEAVWEDLLQEVAPDLRKLVAENAATLMVTCRVTSADGMPDVFLTNRLIARLSDAGCGIDVDIISV